jgi:hypothetical protein
MAGPAGDVVLDAAALVDDGVAAFWYRSKRFGPPQSSVALAAQGISQPSSVAGTEAAASELPQ